MDINPISNIDRQSATAIVVSWNYKEGVLLCVESLIAQECLSKIVLVDNGSVDGTPDAVAAKYPQVEIIRLPENTGFAAASNVGIRRAIELGAKFVLLVNSDIIAPPGAVKEILKAALEERAGAVGAKLIRSDAREILDGGWGVINWRNFVSRVEGENKHDCAYYNKRRHVDYALGAFLLLSAEALEKAGLFDETYFAYHEEMELCERIRRAGFPVVYEPVAVYHGVGKSVQAAGANLAREYLLARNSVKFAKKYATFFQLIKFYAFVKAAAILKFVPAIFAGRLTAHIANIAGWTHGFWGRPLDAALKKKYRLQ